MAGIGIVEDPEAKTPAPALGKAIGDRAYELGLWANLIRYHGARAIVWLIGRGVWNNSRHFACARLIGYSELFFGAQWKIQ
ncbi:unnamed protein product [Penicillium salamii]|uniref:Uncharacterized protein n=1 Tax=Penicillium salamii TaxID=1612424 RepID=A0A9W4JM11_9EURO|nr:unnamed protein product [Penicillium salamii]CAG8052319.1 unnamed protein product [Penicillium salamii]CAG8117343.1 unnamed protein product [Penicillium salamii]CAG8257799.1 unnamed protein product [Penicillium salamii]CAG8296872.1 unnamed protein product [Penicillium salamii]